MTRSSTWLTVKTALTDSPPGLLLVSSVGLFLTRRQATAAAARHTGIPWKSLYREGWRVVWITVRERR